MEGLLGFLPYALLFLLCPLMMVFMHRGHGERHEDHADPAELARRTAASTEKTRA